MPPRGYRRTQTKWRLPCRPPHTQRPALAVAALVAVGIGQAQLRESFGQLLGRVAEQTAAAADTYVFRHLVEVSTLAKVPTLRAESSTASSDTEDADAVWDIDRRWGRLVGLPIEVNGLLDNQASRFLREAVRDDPVYRELLLSDRHGRLVAASGMTSDYYQGDEKWWSDVAVGGRVSIGDVAWDESANVFALEVAVPVNGESGNLVGDAAQFVDVTDMQLRVDAVRHEVERQCDEVDVAGRSPLPNSVPSTRSAPAITPNSAAATAHPRSLCGCTDSTTRSRCLMVRPNHSMTSP